MRMHIWLFVLAQLFWPSHGASRSASLNNSHLGTDGVGVILTENHVQIVNNMWQLDPSSQEGTDLELRIESAFGFRANAVSNISLTILGSTASNETREDGEFLLLFAVADVQYFSVIISLQKGQAWKSFPPTSQGLATAADSVYLDIVAPDTPQRYHRLCNATLLDSGFYTDAWDKIGELPFREALEWPLHVHISNDPINERVTYNCHVNGETLTVQYSSAFVVERGLNVYIMNDASDGKPFTIASIDVTYEYESDAPATAPTNAPHTPSPLLMVTAMTTTTSKPTREAQEVENTVASTQDNAADSTQSFTDDAPTQETDPVVVVLAVVIAVLVCGFCLFCVGFYLSYVRPRRRQRALSSDGCTDLNKAVYTNTHPPPPHAGFDAKPKLSQVPSQSAANSFLSGSVHKHSSNAFRHHSLPLHDIDDDDEHFGQELGNIAGANNVMLDDVIENMATSGRDGAPVANADDEYAYYPKRVRIGDRDDDDDGDDDGDEDGDVDGDEDGDDDEDDGDFAHLNENRFAMMNAEGGRVGMHHMQQQHHDRHVRINSDGVSEGGDHITGGYNLSFEEKVNSLNSQELARGRNSAPDYALLMVQNAAEDEVIDGNSDDAETLGASNKHSL